MLAFLPRAGGLPWGVGLSLLCHPVFQEAQGIPRGTMCLRPGGSCLCPWGLHSPERRLDGLEQTSSPDTVTGRLSPCPAHGRFVALKQKPSGSSERLS